MPDSRAQNPPPPASKPPPPPPRPAETRAVQQRPVQQQQQQRPAAPPVQGPLHVPMGNVGFDIANASDLWELAGYIAKSDLKPRGMKTQADVFLVMAYGQMYGFDEMEALQKLVVIRGKVGLPAQEMVAKIRAHPLCRSYRLWVEGEGDERSGCCHSWRLGQEQPNDVVRFSIADARRAGLYDEDWRDDYGDPSNWVRYTDDQLIWKAAARDYRRNWPDAYGYRLTPIEELREIARTERDDDEPQPLETRRAVARPAPPPASPVLQALAAGEQRIEFELPRAREPELVERSPIRATEAPHQLTLEVAPEPAGKWTAEPTPYLAAPAADEPAREVTLPSGSAAAVTEAPAAEPFGGELELSVREAMRRRIASLNLLDEHAARAVDQLEELVRMRLGAGVPTVQVLLAVRDWRPRF